MDEALWAFGRGTGLVAIVLVTVSVLLGILTRSGRPLPGLARFSILLVHRNVSLLSTVFITLHVGSLLLDSYAHLHIIDVYVPFLGSFKPFWQGLGTVAVDLLIAVVLTSLMRRWIGIRIFRAVHWITYLMWPVTLVHAIGNGSDGTSRWFLILAAASVTAVTAALVWRISPRFVESSRLRGDGAR
jgi:sulfoxide reductase heme-binding subunit YedZ